MFPRVAEATVEPITQPDLPPTYQEVAESYQQPPPYNSAVNR